MKRKYLAGLLCFLGGYIASPGLLANEVSENNIIAGHFSALPLNSLLPGLWKPLVFDNIEKKTAYYITTDNNTAVLKAVSHASASGIIQKVNIDPGKFPVISWRWKISNLIEKADILTKQGDDYPARLYITFQYDINKLSGIQKFKAELYKSIYGEYPPLAVLNYVWDNKQPVNSLHDNAYTDRVKMIVVQTGSENLQQWVKQRRNIYADYKRAFGEPPGNITGIAIMTDTDNTQESAMAYYGDITFSRKDVTALSRSTNQ